jgi:hypothetical protein
VALADAGSFDLPARQQILFDTADGITADLPPVRTLPTAV